MLSVFGGHINNYGDDGRHAACGNRHADLDSPHLDFLQVEEKIKKIPHENFSRGFFVINEKELSQHKLSPKRLEVLLPNFC